MKIQNIQYTQVKTKEYEILFPYKMPHIKIQDLSKEGNEMGHFVFTCKGVLERNLLDKNPRFEEIEFVMVLYIFRGKLEVNQRYQIFDTKQDACKFVECVIHREDIIAASKVHKVLYQYLKEKPCVDGIIGHKYEEEGDLK